MNFYKSKGYSEVTELNKKWNTVPDYQNNWSLYQTYKEETEAVKFKYASIEESEGGLEQPAYWEAISIEDFGKFREPYFDKIDLTNEMWEKSKQEWAWGNKVQLSFNLGNMKLNKDKHFYGFDRLIVVDDAVYALADGLGVIPGIDIVGDVIGAAYAGIIRRDLGNTLIYTASASVPFVGAAYVKGGLKAGEDASHLFGIVAKKADNVEGFVLETKMLKDIQAGEVHVASVFYGADKQLTDKVLAEVKRESKSIDGDLIRIQLNRATEVKVLKGTELLNHVKESLRKSGLSDDVLRRLDNNKIWTDEKLQTLNHYLSDPKKYGNLAEELKNKELFDAVEEIIDNPINAWDIIKQTQSDEVINAVVDRIGKSQFFKEVVGRGRVFETLVTSQIKTINPPFADLVTDGFTHLDQIHLLRVGPNGKKIIADDLFVKLVKDEDGLPYYRGVISDSKLSSGSPWTDNQKSELINIFRDDKTREFIEFEVRSDNLSINSPIKKTEKIRIYREDVYKIISDGENIKVPPIKQF